MNCDNYNFSKVIRKSSKTFYITSLFFPKDIRRDVHILYSFLRISDDLIDSVPPKEDEFIKLKSELFKSLNGEKTENCYIDAFTDLVKRKGIEHQLIYDYLASQELDLKKRSYNSYEELCNFIYGVADVVGILMAKVMNLKEESFDGARKLASAMQIVNIIRDIPEDLLAGKVYLPQDELTKFGLSNRLSKEEMQKYPKEYGSFIKFQLERAGQLLSESKKSFKFIPENILLPIKIVTKIYENVIERIISNPQQIFKKKMKPTILTILKISIKQYYYD
jgi:15-cis-phytoene synthase